MCVCLCGCLCVCVCVCVCVCARARLRAHVQTLMCMDVLRYVRMHVCVYNLIYIIKYRIIMDEIVYLTIVQRLPSAVYSHIYLRL
jgi:hypothetical protein